MTDYEQYEIARAKISDPKYALAIKTAEEHSLDSPAFIAIAVQDALEGNNGPR